MREEDPPKKNQIQIPTLQNLQMVFQPKLTFLSFLDEFTGQMKKKCELHKKKSSKFTAG